MIVALPVLAKWTTEKATNLVQSIIDRTLFSQIHVPKLQCFVMRSWGCDSDRCILTGKVTSDIPLFYAKRWGWNSPQDRKMPHQWLRHLSFRFLALRIMRKSFLSFKFPSLWYFCYCSLSRQIMWSLFPTMLLVTEGWRMEDGGEATYIYSAVSLGVCTAGALSMAHMLPVNSR